MPGALARSENGTQRTTNATKICNHESAVSCDGASITGPLELAMPKSARIYAILLVATGHTHLAWAQEGANVESPVPPNFRFPVGAEITFQWNYACRAGNKPCAFSCGTADRVKALTIYLGTMPVGSYERNSVIFYFYSTETIPYSGGFRINGGLGSTLSCDVSGMTLDYAGPPIGIPTPQGGVPNNR
jgi:hypothetical protein